MRRIVIALLALLVAAPAFAAVVLEINTEAPGVNCAAGGVKITAGATDFFVCNGSSAGPRAVDATNSPVAGVTALATSPGSATYVYASSGKAWTVDYATGQPYVSPGYCAIYADNACATAPFTSSGNGWGFVYGYADGTNTYIPMYPSGISAHNAGNTPSCYGCGAGPCTAIACPATTDWLDLHAAGTTPTLSGVTPPLHLEF